MREETLIITDLASQSQAIALANYGNLPITDFLSVEKPAATGDDAALAAVAYSKEALHYYLIADYQAALNVYTKAIEAFPKEPFFYAGRWVINQLLNDDEGAFYDYQVAKRLDFNYHSLLEWLENKEQLEELIADSPEIAELEVQVSLNPTQVDGYHELALAYVHAFDYLKAIDLYSRSLRLAEQASTYVFRGAIYAKTIQYTSALADFNSALELDPTFQQAFIFRAKLMESLGCFEESLADYTHALALKAETPIVFEERASLYERLAMNELALADYNMWIDLAKDDFYPLTLRADLKERMEDWEGALADYTAAIALNPYYSDLYQYRGDIKARLGDQQGANADFEKFEALEEEEN